MRIRLCVGEVDSPDTSRGLLYAACGASIPRILGITSGKLTPIYWYNGELRFLRSEIEAWKAKREQRTRALKQEPRQ